MNFLATITSKRQLTIPADIFKKLDFAKGNKVLIRQEKNQIIIKPVHSLINNLAGSVRVAERLKNIDLDQVITSAKKTHFRNQK